MACENTVSGIHMPDANNTRLQLMHPGEARDTAASNQTRSCDCLTEAVSQSDCGCHSNQEVNCNPIKCTYDISHDENAHKYRICCDTNGCCCKYPCNCRNPFWPEFAHPRWLCCKALYSDESDSCYDND